MPIDKALCGAGRVSGAEIRGFQNSAHNTLGRDRMFPHKLRVSRQQAAEILRPGAVYRGIHDDMTDMPGAQILGLRWETQKRVDLALHEKLDRLYRGVGNPVDIRHRIKPDMSGQDSEQHMWGRSKGLHPDGPALELGNTADAFVGE